MVMENEQTGRPDKNSEPVSLSDVPGGERLKNELVPFPVSEFRRFHVL